MEHIKPKKPKPYDRALAEILGEYSRLREEAEAHRLEAERKRNEDTDRPTDT